MVYGENNNVHGDVHWEKEPLRVSAHMVVHKSVKVGDVWSQNPRRQPRLPVKHNAASCSKLSGDKGVKTSVPHIARSARSTLCTPSVQKRQNTAPSCNNGVSASRIPRVSTRDGLGVSAPNPSKLPPFGRKAQGVEKATLKESSVVWKPCDVRQASSNRLDSSQTCSVTKRICGFEQHNQTPAARGLPRSHSAFVSPLSSKFFSSRGSVLGSTLRENVSYVARGRAYTRGKPNTTDTSSQASSISSSLSLQSMGKRGGRISFSTLSSRSSALRNSSSSSGQVGVSCGKLSNESQRTLLCNQERHRSRVKEKLFLDQRHSEGKSSGSGLMKKRVLSSTSLSSFSPIITTCVPLMVAETAKGLARFQQKNSDSVPRTALFDSSPALVVGLPNVSVNQEIHTSCHSTSNPQLFGPELLDYSSMSPEKTQLKNAICADLLPPPTAVNLDTMAKDMSVTLNVNAFSDLRETLLSRTPVQLLFLSSPTEKSSTERGLIFDQGAESHLTTTPQKIQRFVRLDACWKWACRVYLLCIVVFCSSFILSLSLLEWFFDVADQVLA